MRLSKLSIHRACFVSVIAFALNAADAQASYGREQPRWYASISGFMPFLNDPEYAIRYSGTSDRFPEAEFDAGYGIGAALGYTVTPYFRTEVEAAWRENELGSIQGISYQPSDPGKYSAQRSIALMANGYLQYPNSTFFTPYIGAGIGMAQVRSSLENIDAIIQQITLGQDLDAKGAREWVLAYQFMAGLNYEVPYFAMGKSEIFLGYRYFTGQEAEDKSKLLPGASITYRNDSHNAELGWRLYF